MSDGVFYTLVIVFFFLLWLASGGPTKPISFAGAFITPITNLGQTQSGYGPKLTLNTKISAVGGSAGVSSSTGIPDTSPYAGDVVLTHSVSSDGTDPAQEYIGLVVTDAEKQSVTISGWKLVSTVSGSSATIPQGVPTLKLGSVNLQPIVMTPGNQAYLTTGASPVNVSFEQNTCVNYISNAQNYTNCVTKNQSDSGFLTGTWRIYFDKSSRLWKDKGDTIELLDNSGKVVDSFSN